MREIEFRAKVIKDIQISSEGFIPAGEWLTWYPLSFVPNWKECIDPDSIFQYTGFTDKNDIKVFEGDIVQYENPDHNNDEDYHMRYIVWDEKHAAFRIWKIPRNPMDM